MFSEKKYELIRNRKPIPRPIIDSIQNIVDNSVLEDDLEIIIGNFIFELISFDEEALCNRGLLRVLSTNLTNSDVTQFFLYPSNSELGFWRLYSILWRTENISTFNDSNVYKGSNDYVAESFVHLKLQNFININFHKIKRKLKDYIINTNKIYDAYQKEGRQKKINILSYKLVKKLKEQGIRLPDFPMASYCGDKHANCSEELQIISDVIEENYNYKKIDESYNIKKKLKLDNENILHLNGEIKKIELSYNHNLDSLIHEIRQLDDIDEIRELGNIEIIMNKMILYYLKYSFIIENNNEEQDYYYSIENQYIPIILLENDDDNSITEYGLYNNYITSGNYICKAIEYNDQHSFEHSYIIEHSSKRYKDKYTYIGYNYQNIFPFNQIREDEYEDQEEFKYFKKYLKYKKKYLS